jgi:hypothetical protein
VGVHGAIEANALYKFLERISADDITLSADDKEVIIKAGRAKAGFTLHSEIAMPLQEVPEPKRWVKLPDGFCDVINTIAMVCATDMSRPLLTCVHVDGKKGIVEGSDSRALMRSTVPRFNCRAFLLPARIAQIAARYALEETANSKGWQHFKSNEGTLIHCRVFEDNYPDTSQHLDVEGISVRLPKDMHTVLERAGVFSGSLLQSTPVVAIRLADGEALVRARGDSGWFEERMPVRYKKEPLAFGINPMLLQRILTDTNECTIGERTLGFKGDNWKYAVAKVINYE